MIIITIEGECRVMEVFEEVEMIAIMLRGVVYLILHTRGQIT